MLMSNIGIAAAVGLIWFFSFGQLGLIIRVASKDAFWQVAGFLFCMGGLGLLAAAINFAIILITGSTEVIQIESSNQSIETVGIIMISIVVGNIIGLPIIRWFGKQL